MLPQLLPIASLMLGTALLLLGNGLMSTLLALRGSLEGFSDQLLGLMGSAYFVGFLIGTWAVPQMIRRIGHIRAFAYFASTIAAVILLHSLIVNAWVWLALRLATGIALVGFYTVIESWLNSRSEAQTRGQVFAIYMVVNMVALAGAQQFLHFASPQSFVLFSVAAMLVCLSVLPLVSTRQPQPQIHRVPRLTLREMWGAAPTAVLAAIVSGLSMGTFWSMAPLYAARLGYDAGGVAMLMTATIVGGAVLQLPLGRLSDRYDRRYALALAAGGGAAGAVLMALFGNTAWALLTSAFVFGGMAFALYPITVAHCVDHLPQEQILSGNAGMLLLHGIGAVAGPTLAGALMTFGGAAALPLFFAATLLPLAAYIALFARGHRDEIVDEAAQFVPMVRTTPTAVEMVAAAEEHRLESTGPTDSEPAPAPRETGA
ncbi:MAG: MFS transporter [Pseudazoarcus pumilus]|nr:MFS transporter [Pseudazoarcus pumilus]